MTAVNRRWERARKGERAMVPRAEFRSYYGQPIISPPVWQEREIAGYLFLGGLAGAASAMAAGAHLTGRPGLARVAKLGSAIALSLSLGALVEDLGRPSRFVNMLRVFKTTSPMSVGSWLLAAFGPASLVAAGSELAGVLPAVGTAATVGAGLLGPGVASYTAALISDTAVPAWHEGWKEMPFVFVASAASAAGGLGLVGAALSENRPARLMAVAGGALELGLERAMEERMGMAGEAYRSPGAHRLLLASRFLTGGGVLGALIFGRRSRVGSALAGVALMAGSALTRFGIFRAGMASAEDPRFTVEPQRARRAGVSGADTAPGLRP